MVCAFLSGVAVLPAAAAPMAPAKAPSPRATQTFLFKGAPQTYTVPAGANVTITADGAGGADNTGTSCSMGGTGARVVTHLLTTAVTTYTITVGGASGQGCTNSGQGGAGGFNGGGPGGTSGAFHGGPGGGGASSVSAGSTLLVVAGGGGAAGGAGTFAGGDGGNGGTPDATPGGPGEGSAPGFGGGGGRTSSRSTPGSGGSGGSAPPCTGTSGGPGSRFSGAAVGTGGSGGSYGASCSTGDGAGGGGGGGYFAGGGGGAGADSAGGGAGGGGSSYTTPSSFRTTYALSPVGTANSNGQVTIAYTTTPSLTIRKVPLDPPTFNDIYFYDIVVSNSALAAPTSGTVTVTDTPHDGRVLDLRGSGWDCSPATATCSRTDALQPGLTYPTILALVRYTGGPATNEATVTGGGIAVPQTVQAPAPAPHCETTARFGSIPGPPCHQHHHHDHR